MTERLNAFLDRIGAPVFQRRLPPSRAFAGFGLAGLACALTVAATLCWLGHLSGWTVAAMAVAAVATFFVLAWSVKWITGEERLVCYWHQIAVYGVWAALLGFLRRPALEYLDTASAGFAIFLAFGRIGCLLTGCCHGLPGRLGVRYTKSPRAPGIPALYAGVRLLPVQAFESLLNVFLCLCCFLLAAGYGRPGDAFGAYIAGYALGRFFLEIFRGDADRPQWRGVSEAQGTALILMLAATCAGWRGWIPQHAWYGAAAAMLSASAGVLMYFRSDKALFDAWHVWEVAHALNNSADAVPEDGGIAMLETSRGLRISRSREGSDAGEIAILAFSRPSQQLTPADAARLGMLAQALCGRSGSDGFCDLIGHERGVYRMVMYLPPARMRASIPLFLRRDAESRVEFSARAGGSHV